jgi:tRNA-2-methylthio-N6-dimethylallyladenosine synthase
MNERDSEALAAQLLARGYTLAKTEAEADVILLNTCSVRDMAEQKALNKMRNLSAETHRRGKPVVLGFMGCMAQSRGAQLLEQLPKVGLVLGTQKAHHAADYLDELLAGRRDKIVDTEEEPGSESFVKEHILPAAAQSVTAFVSIMQGCNQHCTFCIVPHTRGAERSRSIPDIVTECRGLVENGVKEITLLGQIVTSYGKRDLPAQDGKSAFVQLLEAVHAIDGLERIRFTAPHPKGYGTDLVQAYGRLPKLCESAHIPAQSGSDRVLKLMHRGYTRQRFADLIRDLRAQCPTIGITTDLIVGFPGETEDDFQQTLSLASEVEFDNAYIFKYSQRKDTPAASMPDQLSEEVKEDRHHRLLEVVNTIGTRRYQALVGQAVEVLVEGNSRKNPTRMAGRTRCNKIALIERDSTQKGDLEKYTVARIGLFTLYCKRETSPESAGFSNE